jgi:hypothetical protein
MYTPEQCYAIEWYLKQLPLKVIAFAGAGKTSTLVAMAKQHIHRRGLYVAFNKSIATEAATKFPRSVEARTAHSLAWRTCIGMKFDGDRKLRNSPQSRTFDLSVVRDKLPIAERNFRSIVATTIRNFCQSDARSIVERHVPKVPGLTEEEQEFCYNWATYAAASVWDRMSDPRDDMPLGGDGYVKVWSLTDPRLFCDYLMVDEAQDLNPVLIHVVRNQQCQVVAVGDSHQQIYGWRGAVDALKILPGHESRLTKSFRFGDEIARAANRCLMAMGEQFPLHGHGAIKDAVVTNSMAPHVDAVLCRSNSGVIEQALHYIDAGRSVATPGGTGEMFALVEDAEALQSDMPARTAELMAFKTWKAVTDYAATEEGRSLKVFVNLVSKYGVRRLRHVLSLIKDKAAPGDVMVSTAHKGKGLEWPSVLIGPDFLAGSSDDDEESRISMDERRLFYVAITRAQRTLYVDGPVLAAYSTRDDHEDD